MSMPEEPVDCERHGASHATFVCAHLADGTGTGFFVATADPDDPYPDAWCAACEYVANAAGGWDEESERAAGITLVCAGCYDEIRARAEGRGDRERAPGPFPPEPVRLCRTIWTACSTS